MMPASRPVALRVSAKTEGPAQRKGRVGGVDLEGVAGFGGDELAEGFAAEVSLDPEGDADGGGPDQEENEEEDIQRMPFFDMDPE